MRVANTGRSARVDPLAKIPLTEGERREAEHYLLLGERVAELIVSGAGAVAWGLRSLERNLRGLARGRSTS